MLSRVLSLESWLVFYCNFSGSNQEAIKVDIKLFYEKVHYFAVKGGIDTINSNCTNEYVLFVCILTTKFSTVV